MGKTEKNAARYSGCDGHPGLCFPIFTVQSIKDS